MVRRTFIRQMARGSILGAMAAVAGLLLARNQVTVVSEDCAENFRCRSCNRLTGCSLPEARITREEDGKG
ncbi:MAG: hypothetical protein ACWGNV_03115 [Bacteroidales bacterium]